MNLTSAEIVLIITTVFTGIVSVVGAFKSNGNSNKLMEVRDTTIRQDVKLDNIHAAANGNLERAQARIEALTAEVTKLKQLELDRIK